MRSIFWTKAQPIQLAAFSAVCNSKRSIGTALLVSKRRWISPNLVVLYSSWKTMAEQPRLQNQQVEAELPSSQAPKEDMIAYVMALEAALFPCVPARELQAIDRWPHPSHQIDVERHARDFMEAAKKLQHYFVGLQRKDQPTKTETLRKDMALMEEKVNVKNEIIKKQERLIHGWGKELKDQLDKHNNETF